VQTKQKHTQKQSYKTHPLLQKWKPLSCFNKWHTKLHTWSLFQWHVVHTMQERQSADTNVIIGQYRLSADYQCISIKDAYILLWFYYCVSVVISVWIVVCINREIFHLSVSGLEYDVFVRFMPSKLSALVKEVFLDTDICYSALVGVQSIVINPSFCLFVCVCVCLWAYLWNRSTNLHKILCASPLWPWLCPHLAALQ